MIEVVIKIIEQALKDNCIFVGTAYNEESGQYIKLDRFTNELLLVYSRKLNKYVFQFYFYDVKDLGFVYQVDVLDYCKNWCLKGEKNVK